MSDKDKKIIDIFVDIVGDKQLILSLLSIPDFNPQQFLFFKGWYYQRENDTKKLSNKKEMMESFCDLYLLFPYCEGLRDWLNSNLTNAEIAEYRGDGLDLETAKTLAGK